TVDMNHNSFCPHEVSSLILLLIGESLFIFGRVGLIEGRPESLRKFHRILIGPEVHEEKARLLFQHMAMKRRDCDSVLAKRFDNRIHFLSGENKVPVIAAFPVPVGWKLSAVATPIELGTAIPFSMIFSARGTENW